MLHSIKPNQISTHKLFLHQRSYSWAVRPIHSVLRAMKILDMVVRSLLPFQFTSRAGSTMASVR